MRGANVRYNRKLSQRSGGKPARSGWQITPSWIVLLSFLGLSIALLAVGAGRLLNLAFPLGGLLVGLFLYYRNPILFMQFNWWLWFLVPLVRRLSDYRSGFTDPSPILLTPFLVTGITVITLWRALPKLDRSELMPFLLSLVGITYGAFIGFLQGSPVAVVIGILDILVPILFGFHLFANWRYYPTYRQAIQQTFLAATLVTGVYGIYQYLVAPAWDRFWLTHIPVSSFGLPVPLGIRVWSTMNSPVDFAVVIMAGLLIAFSSRSLIKIPALIAGYLAFLLSAVRTAWVGWGIGMIYLIVMLKSSLKIRLLIVLMLASACLMPLISMAPFSDTIYSRIDTLSNLENDGSGSMRRSTYAYWLPQALTNLVGWGIGHTSSHDSAILGLLLSLGLVGGLLYFGGIIQLLLRLLQGEESHFDGGASAARSIVLSGLSITVLAPVLYGITGIVIWGFLGMGLAARKYYSARSATSATHA